LFGVCHMIHWIECENNQPTSWVVPTWQFLKNEENRTGPSGLPKIHINIKGENWNWVFGIRPCNWLQIFMLFMLWAALVWNWMWMNFKFVSWNWIVLWEFCHECDYTSQCGNGDRETEMSYLGCHGMILPASNIFKVHSGRVAYISINMSVDHGYGMGLCASLWWLSKLVLL